MASEERKRLSKAVIEGANIPIGFWGKVIDQNNKPVAHVLVKFSYSVERANEAGVPWSNTQVIKGSAVSRIDGTFSISDIKGSSLHIESLEKQGFQHNARGAMIFNYFGHTAGGKFIPDRNNPVRFVMLDKATPERLISHGEIFGKAMRLPGDGTPVRWNLWDGRSDPNGELEIAFKRQPAEVTRLGQNVQWSARIHMIDGGIVEAAPDELFHQAPTDGYVKELDYPRTEQKPGLSERHFYIKTAGGKYGRVELHLYPDDEGPTARCLIKSVVNPAGSRNLEAALR
jgi:hypothetical protein